MGLLSSTVSVTRYKVEGKLPDPIMESVYNGLKKNSISEIEDESSEKIVGWTSFEEPFIPSFEGSTFAIASFFVFSLRIDKKAIPSKVLKKNYTIEMAKKLEESGREFLSKQEKKEIKEHVTNVLLLRIPATPNIYDVVWNYEEGELWFLSNLKAANEELETLFSRSFKMNIVRLFPFTMADMTAGLNENQRDVLSKLTPARILE